MARLDLGSYYTWQLEELKRREAILGCLLPGLVEQARLPGVRNALQKALERTEVQLDRLMALIRRDSQRGRDDADPARTAARPRLGTAGASVSSRVQEITSLVTAHEMAVLTACGYAWTHLLAERLDRPQESRLLRRTLQEKADVNLDLMALATELVGGVAQRPRGIRRTELAG